MEFSTGRWANGWATIEISPIDEALFIPMLKYLSEKYGFPMPAITDRITGYFADFEIYTTRATLDIDTYDFAIAFEDDAAQSVVRDRVLADLRNTPPDLYRVDDGD